MIDEIEKMMDGYVSWLREKTSLREIGDWVEITTPMLDRHNDFMQIYVRRENGSFILTDDGYTLQDLEMSGCTLDTPRRQELLRLTLNGFGVQQHGSALEIRASEETFPLKKHSLLQSMIGLNDLFYLAKSYTSSLFYEDVVLWMTDKDIRFVEKVKFTGKSGFDYMFDFVIPRSRKRPERIVKPINRPGKDSAKEMVFAWMDTRDARPPESQAYALLNDMECTVKSDVTDAFLSYDIKPILWSARENVLEELVN